MTTAKLTLSADKALILDAKRIASRHRTSVSAMFGRFLRSVAQVEGDRPLHAAPLTRRATGLIHLPGNRSDKDLVADALSAKYRTDK
jgi:hypothetical protein